MDLPRVPDPDETMAKLNWLLPEIYRSFEHGVFKARNYFETEGVEYDAFAFATFVRLHAKEYLRRKGYEAVEIEKVMLCGLSLRLKEHIIKIWKSDDSALPLPGRSEPKQEFYQQSFVFPNGAGDEHVGPLHLAVLWNLDTVRNLSALWLVCPKSGDEESVEAWWCKRIPDAASMASGPAPQTSPPDLDIQRRVDPKKKTEQG